MILNALAASIFCETKTRWILETIQHELLVCLHHLGVSHECSGFTQCLAMRDNPVKFPTFLNRNISVPIFVFNLDILCRAKRCRCFIIVTVFLFLHQM